MSEKIESFNSLGKIMNLLDTIIRKCLEISGPCIQPVTGSGLCSAGKVELFLQTKICSLSW